MGHVRASLILHKGSRQAEALRPQIPDRSPKAERPRGTGQVHPWRKGPAEGVRVEAVWRVSPIEGQPAQFHGETWPPQRRWTYTSKKPEKMHFKPYLQTLRLGLTQVPALLVR